MDTEKGREILINFADHAECKHDDCGMRAWLMEKMQAFIGEDGKVIGVTKGLQQFLMLTLLPALLHEISITDDPEQLDGVLGSELAIAFLYGQYVGANHGMVIPEMAE